MIKRPIESLGLRRWPWEHSRSRLHGTRVIPLTTAMSCLTFDSRSTGTTTSPNTEDSTVTRSGPTVDAEVIDSVPETGNDEAKAGDATAEDASNRAAEGVPTNAEGDVPCVVPSTACEASEVLGGGGGVGRGENVANGEAVNEDADDAEAAHVLPASEEVTMAPSMEICSSSP